MTEDEEGVESEELSIPRVMEGGNTTIDVDEGDEGQDEKEKKSSAERSIACKLGTAIQLPIIY